jgi:hypothetical protein
MNCHNFAVLIARREEYACGISRVTTVVTRS